MRNIKIVTDSSSDMQLNCPQFKSVPLKIITDSKEFVDDDKLDVSSMIDFLDKYRGTSRSSCPNTSDYLEAFGNSDEVFCITITSSLSGSYNAACAAKQIYESENEGKRVFVIDSLSAGPELRLIADKIISLVSDGRDFEYICQEITLYKERTGLLFVLESMKNLANNGRISAVSAKLSGILGICVVGRASDKGELEALNKCRGRRRALGTIIDHLKNSGLSHGKVHIDHCENEEAAVLLKEMIKETFNTIKVEIGKCRGLCSFYAEKGGLLIGFEKA